MAINVAINGFGRIGMIAAKIIGKRDDINLVAINATMKHDIMEYLLKYDTVHGRYDAKLIDDNYVQIGKDKVRIFSDHDPLKVDFASCGADVVLECTGKFLSLDTANVHLRGSVKKVVISAPAKDETPTYVYGVNHESYKNETVISNASCTTNALAPVTKIIHEAFGILKGTMTTVHSYTNDQNILDVKHSKDKRRARAAALNIIPTSTGAAKAIGKVMPELLGKLNGYSLRVPTPDVSIVDLSALISKDVTKEEVNAVLKQAANGAYAGLVEYDEDYRVSSDFVGSTMSSIVVPDCTQVIDKNMIKVVAWYDNEWGYTSRLIDMAIYVGSKTC